MKPLPAPVTIQLGPVRLHVPSGFVVSHTDHGSFYEARVELAPSPEAYGDPSEPPAAHLCNALALLEADLPAPTAETEDLLERMVAASRRIRAALTQEGVNVPHPEAG